MRLFTRIFFCTIVVLTIAMSLQGFLLISADFQSSLETELQRTFYEAQMLRHSFRSGLYGKSHDIEDSHLLSLALYTRKLAADDDYLAVFRDCSECIYSSFPTGYEFIHNASENEDTYHAVTEKTNGCLRARVQTDFMHEETRITMYVSRNIQSVVDEKNERCDDFIKLYMLTFCVSSAILLVLSLMTVSPVNKLIKVTKNISDGMYSERANIKSNDEIGLLAEHFNAMADQIEQKICDLHNEAVKREEFSMSFAHELKTPLTSVIGYADMICSKSLSEDEIAYAANFIRSEGMRLESLSLKMMELIVCEKQDFTLIEVLFSECIQDLSDTLTPLAEKYGVNVTYEIQDEYVRIEPDLFKTLLINITDNSIKAGAKNIDIIVKSMGEKYEITVKDDGCGIPEDELSKITEAFYMVDKSRSGRQHGAGLGLAISSAIAKVHGTQLMYESEQGKGTQVKFVI